MVIPIAQLAEVSILQLREQEVLVPRFQSPSHVEKYNRLMCTTVLTPQHHALLDGRGSRAQVCTSPQLIEANLWSPATSVGLEGAVPLVSPDPNRAGLPVIDGRNHREWQ